MTCIPSFLHWMLLVTAMLIGTAIGIWGGASAAYGLGWRHGYRAARGLFR